MTAKQVYRYEVPIDDDCHPIPQGPVVHVDARSERTVEVWVEVGGLFPPGTSDERAVQVFGTGHRVPGDAKHLGTALSPASPPIVGRPRGELVWHLYQLADA